MRKAERAKEGADLTEDVVGDTERAGKAAAGRADSLGGRCWLLPLAAYIWQVSLYRLAMTINLGRSHGSLESGLDGAVPFLPWSVSIYFLAYIFWAAFYILAARQEKGRVYRFFWADFTAKAVCFAIFVVFPTTNTRPVIEGTGVWDKLMALLYRIDRPSNLFPSIHCLDSWMCWIGVRGRRSVPAWVRGGGLVMALAVCASTLTTKQHVLPDVAGGIVLAEVCYWLAGRIRPYGRYTKFADHLLRK